MNKIFSWTQNPTYSNKWDRLVLTSKGAFVAAWISLDDEGVYSARIFADGTGEIHKAECKTLEEAKLFADRELRKQGYSA